MKGYPGTWVSSCSNTGPMKDDPYLTSRQNSLDITEKVIQILWFNLCVFISWLKVSASDPDKMEIKYTLQPNSSFSIEQTTGVIKVTGRFDRELQSVYNLTVTAIDKGGLNVSEQGNDNIYVVAAAVVIMMLLLLLLLILLLLLLLLLLVVLLLLLLMLLLLLLLLLLFLLYCCFCFTKIKSYFTFFLFQSLFAWQTQTITPLNSSTRLTKHQFRTIQRLARVSWLWQPLTPTKRIMQRSSFLFSEREEDLQSIKPQVYRNQTTLVFEIHNFGLAKVFPSSFVFVLWLFS